MIQPVRVAKTFLTSIFIFRLIFLIVKKIFTILMSALLIIALGSCRRATDNGKIDGFWHIREIQYNDGSSSYPEKKMIAVQLELLQLDDPQTTPLLTGVLDYHKNDKVLGVDFRYKPSDADLYPYGFAGNPELSGPSNTYCRLDIVQLDSRHLVLRSPIALITCRRY